MDARERIELSRTHEHDLNSRYGRAFAYDPERKEFVVGTKVCTYTFPLEHTIDIADFNLATPPGIDSKNGPYFILLRGFDLVVQPALRKYVEQLGKDEWNDLARKIRDIMYQTLKQLSPDINIRKIDGGFVGFVAQRSDDGNFFLKTLGNAAGIGPATERSNFDEWTSDFPQVYGFANTDTEAQRLSVCAGIGALAWYAEKELSKDKSLKGQQLGLALE